MLFDIKKEQLHICILSNQKQTQHFEVHQVVWLCNGQLLKEKWVNKVAFIFKQILLGKA